MHLIVTKRYLGFGMTQGERLSSGETETATYWTLLPLAQALALLVEYARVYSTKYPRGLTCNTLLSVSELPDDCDPEVLERLGAEEIDAKFAELSDDDGEEVT